ncbi:type IX secretion system sortase PorU [Algoriphagus halophytocola]|uniref:Type IX secretion system sortase PorU n=1 Tax=Algoriphagus halophytocola TaxID=2991499 RepID=A0ABY6MNL6_9BACT|nr:type IX secretion system sortase PorU [Algoriphagus sp. TR-M5]UZD24286.1 type IX secretion system sortase PorU [Algoriphagus sp. TR-M5]
MTCACFRWILVLLASCTFHQLAQAQHTFFKFSIEKDGVYSFSEEQAKALGASNLSEIAFYGFPGMLPQVLNENNLRLQEIPALENQGQLLVYLNGPDTFSPGPDNSMVFTPNQFSDSQSYLISIRSDPKRIPVHQAGATPSSPATLYEWHWIKEEENNIINSGRNWYSRPIAPGVTRGYAFPLSTDLEAPWRLSAALMTRSLSDAETKIAVDELEISTSTIESIPNETYGVKGKELWTQSSFLPNGQEIERLRISFLSSDQNSAGYFQYIGIGVPFSSINPKPGIYHLGNEIEFTLQLDETLQVWDISEFLNPKNIDLSTGSTINSSQIIVFSPQEAPEIPIPELVPLYLDREGNWPELIIIAPRELSAAAERLSSHKFGMGIYSKVYYLEDIFNSFGYGNPDVTAIRNFLAFHFHKGKALQNVLLLGKGTFDHKGIIGGRPNLLPIYTSRNSLDPLKSYSSDDYYALLQYGQGAWEESQEGDEQLQIGVGRLPVINPAEAKTVVDKIIAYETIPSPGKWKESLTFFADDGDSNIHLRDSESHSNYLAKIQPKFNLNKLYLDHYPQLDQRSEEAKKSLTETLEQGTLLLNYVGHGNQNTLTAEEIFEVSDIRDWKKTDQLALWVTATCEFGRHDSPYLRSAAEELLIAKGKGAIGLLSTGRPVFSSVNFSLNQAFIEKAFLEVNGDYQDLGSIFRQTKNSSQNGALNRNFSLLADPSMRLAKASATIQITALNDPDNGRALDTLSALQVVEFEASVLDPASQNLIQSFDGKYTLEISDKPIQSETLGDESSSTQFSEEKNLLFRGEGKIDNGGIKGKFIVPKNIDLEHGVGNIRIWGESEDASRDAFGLKQQVIGGTNNTTSPDEEGPLIIPSFNSQSAPPFSFASSTILLSAEMHDASGINVSGFDPNQNLTIQLNGQETFIANSYFTSKNNTFTSGNLNFVLEGLQEGQNLISITAWDNVGNFTTIEQEIWIEGSDKLQIISHKVYPNPGQTVSHFELMHNQPGKTLNLTLEVYQTDGKILFTHQDRLVKADVHIRDLSWFFFQNQTKYPAKGTYIYKLTLQSESDNSAATVGGQIVIQ